MVDPREQHEPERRRRRDSAVADAAAEDERRRTLIRDALQAAGTLQAQGKLPEAERLYGLILDAEPDHFAALVRMCALRVRQGRADEAVAMLKQASDTAVGSSGAQVNLGIIFAGIGRLDEAMACYERALEADPRNANAYCNLGNILQARGRRDEAVKHYEQALAIRPDFPEAHSNLGNVLLALGRHDEAIRHYEEALTIKPDYAEAHCNLASALLALGRPEEATEHFVGALKIKREFPEAYHGVGLALQVLGRLPAAGRAFEQAVRLAPLRADFHLMLANSKPFTAGDPRLAALERLAQEQRLLGEEQLIALNFALAKGYGDLQQHERAFHHLIEGNALKRKRIIYDEEETLGRFERIRKMFTGDLLRSGYGDPSHTPVFVIGMPRSGTTLVEQILASHSQVFGAGELDAFRQEVDRLEAASRRSRAYPELVATLSEEDLRDLGARYVSRARRLAPTAKRVIDKMAANFLFAGLIHMALPHAPIIHVRRDPIDTCFSCFSVLFTGDQPYAYDLAELGRYYSAYHTLMEHWRRILPPGVMLEVRYEDIVDDLETQARRIMGHCGLDWERECLDFHQTQRPVQTASAVQVRQPLYASSVGRWRPYGDMLQPLIQELDAEDRWARTPA
jgi:tetratricopeptide (TPR) repeat protein